jgi:hypothetical protein
MATFCTVCYCTILLSRFSFISGDRDSFAYLIRRVKSSHSFDVGREFSPCSFLAHKVAPFFSSCQISAAGSVFRLRFTFFVWCPQDG